MKTNELNWKPTGTIFLVQNKVKLAVLRVLWEVTLPCWSSSADALEVHGQLGHGRSHHLFGTRQECSWHVDSQFIDVSALHSRLVQVKNQICKGSVDEAACEVTNVFDWHTTAKQKNVYTFRKTKTAFPKRFTPPIYIELHATVATNDSFLVNKCSRQISFKRLFFQNQGMFTGQHN